MKAQSWPHAVRVEIDEAERVRREFLAAAVLTLMLQPAVLPAGNS
jgi:hypothetical protein